MKNQFLFYLLIFSTLTVLSQSQISGVVYKDSTMTETISNVKIIVKSVNGKRTFCTKSDSNGCFIVSTKDDCNEYCLIIKKKNYSSIKIEPFIISQKNSKIYFNLMLKKLYSIHDENYEGSSKIISIEKM